MGSDIVKFKLGEVVHLVVDDECIGMITGIVYRPNGISYMVTWRDAGEATHFTCELTTEKTFSEKPA